MTMTLLHSSAPVRRHLADFIAEASDAAETARARALVARVLAHRAARELDGSLQRRSEVRRMLREALAYDRDAQRHEEAVAAMRGFITASVVTSVEEAASA